MMVQNCLTAGVSTYTINTQINAEKTLSMFSFAHISISATHFNTI